MDTSHVPATFSDCKICFQGRVGGTLVNAISCGSAVQLFCKMKKSATKVTSHMRINLTLQWLACVRVPPMLTCFNWS